MVEKKEQGFIGMEHGAGGEQMEELIKETILPLLKNSEGEIPIMDLDDSAVVDGMVFTTDGHTVKPIFFKGGDLGRISVSGTVNDVLAIGGEPTAMALAVILPEGEPMDDVQVIFESAAGAAEEGNVPIVAGDTKVVEKEGLGEPVMTTTGIGKRHPLMDENMEEVGERKTRWLSDNNVKDGDKIVLSGSVGDHGITILSEREGYGFSGEIESDVAPLNDVMEAALGCGGVVAAKDPTRGGLANSLNELSEKSGVGIEVQEDKIPIKGWVESASEMLGVDPLTIGNEGKFVMAVESSKAEEVVEALRDTEHGREASVIGEAKVDIQDVVLKTGIGGSRILEPPVGDPVPRIC